MGDNHNLQCLDGIVCIEAVQAAEGVIILRLTGLSDSLSLLDYDFTAIITAHTAYSVVNVP